MQTVWFLCGVHNRWKEASAVVHGRHCAVCNKFLPRLWPLGARATQLQVARFGATWWTIPENLNPFGAQFVEQEWHSGSATCNCMSNALAYFLKTFFTQSKLELKALFNITTTVVKPSCIFEGCSINTRWTVGLQRRPTVRISTECWGALRGCPKPANANAAGFSLHTRTKWDAMMLPMQLHARNRQIGRAPHVHHTQPHTENFDWVMGGTPRVPKTGKR